MRVKCMATNVLPLTQKALVHVDIPLLNWDVTPGCVYTVYSISLWKNVLHYLLIREKDAQPDWFPAELFEVIDEALPAPMYFRSFPSDARGVNALCGYREMVMDFNHYVDLIEREVDAIEIFNKRKNEIDELEIN